MFSFSYRIYVQRQPSQNSTIATYYESVRATSNYPQYAALERSLNTNQVWNESQLSQPHSQTTFTLLCLFLPLLIPSFSPFPYYPFLSSLLHFLQPFFPPSLPPSFFSPSLSPSSLPLPSLLYSPFSTSLLHSLPLFPSFLPPSQRRKRQASSGTPVNVTVGGTQECGPMDEVCNGPLQAGADYAVRYRLYSGSEFQDYSFHPNASFSTGM